MITSVALAVGLAGAAAVGAPAAQAAQAGEVLTASAASGFFTCGETTPLPNEPSSTSIACLLSDGGTITALGQSAFSSPVPTGWTVCYVYTSLFEVTASGVETLVGTSAPQNCLADAAASSVSTASLAVPVEAGVGYRSRTAMISSYQGTGHGTYTAVSPVVLVLG